MSDAANYADYVEIRRETIDDAPEEPWDAQYPPAMGAVKVGQGASPETVADELYPVRDIQDDRLPWVVPWHEAPETAEDGGAVVIWEGMYDE